MMSLPLPPPELILAAALLSIAASVAIGHFIAAGEGDEDERPEVRR
jgi:hypothetical protein